ncbi:MAG: uroporphyrinogen-III synthase [Herbaspirillum sp.]
MSFLHRVGPVIITRPLAQAGGLVQLVTGLSREAVVFPLLEILPLVDVSPLRTVLDDVAAYGLIIFVSPNAIDAACAVRKEWPSGLLFGVVGNGSRQTLARHGINADNSHIVQPQDAEHQDSEGLLAALDLAALRGQRALIVRGENGREHLADSLRTAQIIVTTVAAYRRLAPQLNAASRVQLQHLIRAHGDWVITSSEALRVLLQMVRELGEPTYVSEMQQQKLLVPHRRIAESARSLGFSDVRLAASGDSGLLAALQFGA